MSLSNPASFPKFPHLANELQDLVWEWSLKDCNPTAHFVQLGSHKLKSRPPEGAGSSVPFLTLTMIEELVWCDPPRELAEMYPGHETQVDILLRTCKQSRRIALRHRKSWGPKGTLQLYDPRDKSRADTWYMARDGRVTIPNFSAKCFQIKYMPPRIFDLPSRKVDNSRDLVILGPEWVGIGRHFQRSFVTTKPDWQLPVPRIPYLALTYNSRESIDSQLSVVSALFRLRPGVLYILINPNEFDNDDIAFAAANPALKTVKDRRKTLETPFKERPGAESLVSEAPDSFWYGTREYYALSWDDLEEKMMNSEFWRQLTEGIEKARQMENNCCRGCFGTSCNRTTETLPAIWKVMSWRDHK
ncbi:hypothetical protein LCI18_014321 [Fusarium solani-melongenae]|uniref:Uncharacterized protein n=1 Tax=Fusarium solani subsp. cucurbitae TaxID=2747967 RepID=A0ACD3ZRD0_FUSSC|nr:hypothetical protein LCI18_014321 [Fusarium solani-melongenae]